MKFKINMKTIISLTLILSFVGLLLSIAEFSSGGITVILSILAVILLYSTSNSYKKVSKNFDTLVNKNELKIITTKLTIITTLSLVLAIYVIYLSTRTSDLNALMMLLLFAGVLSINIIKNMIKIYQNIKDIKTNS